MEYDIKYLVSLLTEALAEISELNDKVHELEVKLEELSSSHPRSNALVVENNASKTVSLTRLIESSETETELSDDIKNHIDHAVDYILKLGKSIPYINNK